MIAIELHEAYEIIESSFELLLAVDADEKVIHASRRLLSECNSQEDGIVGLQLHEIVTGESHEQFKSVMEAVKEGQRDSVLFTVKNCGSIALKARYAESQGGIYIFYGSIVDELGSISDIERTERTKELACLYSIFEWIDVSDSVKKFFMELPDYLARGMQYPEYTVVYSVYQGEEYGQKVEGDKFMKVDLEVSNEIRGEIRVGYLDDKHELLPEEQKMLGEIARMLNLAIERKEYSESLARMRREETGYAREINKLQEEIKARTGELDSQRQKLSTVDSYLDRVSRDWEESKVRLETMFDAIPDKVAIIDLKRNVIMTNRKNVQPGKKCYATFFNSDKPCQDCRLLKVIKEKAPISMDIKHEDSYFEVHALPIFNPEHEVEGIIEFYRDITKEKSYEQQLQQADKLASLGQLVSGIGHEINNPNQFIRGNIKIIEQAFDDMLPILDEYYKEHPDLKIARLKYDFFREHIMMLVSDMAHGSIRIKGIVDGLRKFARRDEGELIDDVDVNTIIDESARLVHNQVHKYAEIELDLAHGLPAFTGNSQKIEQVMINLLINAGQAMPEGKKGNIIVKTFEDDGHIVIEVKDNAKGMNEATVKHIFDPFFTTKRAKGGTGLGLSIAYRIIEEHKGTLSVSSKPGAGTTFTIRIPASKKGNDKSD